MKNFRMLILFVFVLLSGVASGNEVNFLIQDLSHSYLTQSETESVLENETFLRRSLLFSLAKIRNEINDYGGYYDIISQIINDLQTRKVNPVKYVTPNSEAIPCTPDIIYQLQGDGYSKITTDEWVVFLRMLPDFPIESFSIPNTSFSLETVTKLRNLPGNLIEYVLSLIQESQIQLNNQLLADILYNFPYKQCSVDFNVILNDVVKTIRATPIDFKDFKPSLYSKVRSSNVLMEILRYVSDRYPGVLHEMMTPIIYDEQIHQIINVPKLSNLFALMPNHDYPPDIVAAKYDLAEWVETNEPLHKELSEILEPYSPSERLFGLLTHLILPPESVTSLTTQLQASIISKAKALHAHYKLKYLSYSGRFFKPSSTKDIEFLLSSFETKPSESILNHIESVEAVFETPNFNWQEILEDIDFALYSQPRPLIKSILRHLMKSSFVIPKGAAVTFEKFLQQITAPSDCPMPELIEQLPMKFEYKQYPPVKNLCPDGTIVKLIDPESLEKITSTTPYANALRHVINSEPVFVNEKEDVSIIEALEILLNQVHDFNLSKSDILAKVSKDANSFFSAKYTKVCALDADIKRDKIKCPATTLLIDEQSIIELAENDYSFEIIKSLILLQPLYYKNYINLQTREQILHKTLKMRLTNFNGRADVNQNGQLKPLLRQQCSSLIPLNTCKKESMHKMIDPYDLIVIIEPKHRSQYANTIFTKATDVIKEYSTRKEALEAIIQIDDLPINERAELPPNYVTICKPPPIAPQHLQCGANQTLQEIIDPDSLLDIVDTDKESIKQILDEHPLLARKYGILNGRKKILRHFLRQQYLATKGRVVNLAIMNVTENLLINDKGMLAPIITKKCISNPKEQPLLNKGDCPKDEFKALIYDTDALLKHLNSSSAEFLRKQAKNYFILYNDQYNGTELLDLLLKVMEYNGTDTAQDLNHQETPTTKLSCVPLNVYEQESTSGLSCPSNSTLLSVIDPKVILTELAPNPKIKAIIQSLPIPLGVPEKFRNLDVLLHFSTHMKGEMVDEFLNMLKDKFPKTRLDEELPYIHQVCLSNHAKPKSDYRYELYDIDHLEPDMFVIPYFQ